MQQEQVAEVAYRANGQSGKFTYFETSEKKIGSCKFLPKNIAFITKS